MANMTFKTNLLPNSTTLEYSLGSENQRWNIYGELTGNASSADKLKTARNINGTAFDGTANITTANWGTARNISISDSDASNTGTAVSVNGSTAVTLKLPATIKATLKGNADTATALTSNAGSATHPIYFSGGKPAACNIISSGNFRSGFATAFDVNGYGEIGMGLDWHKPTSTNDFDIRMQIEGTHNGIGIAAGSGFSSSFTASNLYSGALYIDNGSNPDGNTQGHGVQIVHNVEGGNIIIYAGKSGTTENWRWEIDAYNGWLRAYCMKDGVYISTPIQIRNNGVYGAVWNDYAEMRNVVEDIDKNNSLAGRCVREIGDDTMALTTERLQKGCKIISDTFGYCIGETDSACTPIAVSGRVLAYCLEGKEIAKEHIGDPVCSGPNGTVSIMTEEEERNYPSRIVGTISAVPDYEEWGTGHVKVDRRIWIYVR